MEPDLSTQLKQSDPGWPLRDAYLTTEEAGYGPDQKVATGSVEMHQFQRFLGVSNFGEAATNIVVQPSWLRAEGNGYARSLCRLEACTTSMDTASR